MGFHLSKSQDFSSKCSTAIDLYETGKKSSITTIRGPLIWTSENLDKYCTHDSYRLGIGLGAFLSKSIRLVENLHDPPLFGAGRKWNFEIISIISV